MKRLALAIALAFLLGSLWATSVAFARPTAIPTYTYAVQGIEISPGIIIGNTRYGATFVGKATGELPGAISVSINYRPPNPGPDVTNTITGGLWSLTVFEDGDCRGTLYGKVDSGGTAQWNGDMTLAVVAANLTITGGTGLYKGKRGDANFSGKLDHAHRIGPAPIWYGTLTLNPN